jgi:peptidoglycan hydrolase-like protein with peptidoglycan-binding domain
MALRSAILAGNTRLEGAASGGPSIKQSPPEDDADAVRRIQKALVALGFSMPLSFPSGLASEPDGKFGTETYRAVLAFQKREFPNDSIQWDGRVGKNTLGRMDQILPIDDPGEPVEVLPIIMTMTTQCRIPTPPPRRHPV